MSGAALMICGTASDVGKSRLVTGLCRAFARRGLSVAPFKGQNMALNSVVAHDGAEIGRAQGTQAEAAGVASEAAMNPVLLKPTSERRSQVVLMGRPWGHLDAAAFQAAKPALVPRVLGALASLRARHDLVLCEGAGSPAEINLLDGDLVNLGLAAAAGVPAVVVGDIDRGGVFAHLYGTVSILPAERRAMVRGFVVNKLRGDPALLGDAAAALEARCGVPTFGVVPYLPGLWLDAEDSLGLGLGWGSAAGGGAGIVHPIDVAVVALPHFANFTDLDPLAAEPDVSVRLVRSAGQLGDPDLVVLPGSKATVADLAWLRRQGLDAAIAGAIARGATVVGICGGYQMLGRSIEDPGGVEAGPGSVDGLGLIAVRTVFAADKRLARRSGTSPGGQPVAGYEIHHGRPQPLAGCRPWFDLEPEPALDGATCGRPQPEGARSPDGAVFATSLHGLFESDAFRAAFLEAVAGRRGRSRRRSSVSFGALRQAQIDRLADACEAHLDVDALLALAKEATA